MSKQAGVRPTRLEWVQENEEGTAPSDPAWNLYSDNVVSMWDSEPDANTTRQNAAGEVTSQGFFNGSESHSGSFTYHLQQWYYDGSDNTVDAGGDFLKPAADNSLRATHTVVSWSEQADGGANDTGRYICTVGKGGHPDSLTAPFETDEGTPIEQGLDYQFQKIRQYDIQQPPESGSTLTINNAGTSEVDVTVENFDASTSETLTVPAGGSATTTASFTDLAVVELGNDVDGDVTVEDGSSNTLATIKGSDKYPAGEGDLGVPATGAGSHASAVGTDYIRFLDDELSIPNVGANTEIISGEMSVEIGLDDNSNLEGIGRNIHATEWTYSISATLAGAKVSVDQTTNYLTEQTGVITWTESTSQSIDFNGAFIQSPGSYSKESGNGKLQLGNEFEAQSITVNA